MLEPSGTGRGTRYRLVSGDSLHKAEDSSHKDSLHKKGDSSHWVATTRPVVGLAMVNVAAELNRLPIPAPLAIDGCLAWTPSSQSFNSWLNCLKQHNQVAIHSGQSLSKPAIA